jgi:glycosyltransferase involved in cell wall biosynthesis
MISVVMASYLGEYRKAAKDRDKKIIRAVNSVLNQTIPAELVLVSDGCQKTIDIIIESFPNKVNGYYIEKQKIWSGKPRNVGIEKAKNDIICYCDIDDYLDPDHCEKIYNAFEGDWVWFDDLVYNQGRWIHRKCDVNKKGMCGTSNLAHKKIAWWPDPGSYAHDYIFIHNLKKASSNYKYIGNGGYRVCHVPGKYYV